MGFIIAYNSEQAAVFNDATALQLVTKLDDFVVVKQVAVKRDHTSRGIAHQLYSHLIKRVRGRLIAATVDTPPNVRSRRFHQRLGFTEAFRIPNPDGRVRTVWRYSSEHITDASLYAQYEQAIKLYSHEDSLNWQKLQNYFYITVALSAALGFLLTSTAPVTLIPTRLLGILVITIGVLSSLAFAVALVSGTTYLHVRKQAVCELEDIYINRGGVRVVSTLLRRPIFRRSPTIWTLRLTPLVGVAGWIAMGLYLALAPGT